MKKKPITETSTSHYPDSKRKVTIKWKLASEPVQSEGGTERKAKKKGEIRFPRQADGSAENPLPPA